LAHVLCKAKKNYIYQEAGENMKQKLLEMVQVTLLFHTDEFIFVLSLNNGNGRQNLLGCHNWFTSTGGCQYLVPE